MDSSPRSYLFTSATVRAGHTAPKYSIKPIRYVTSHFRDRSYVKTEALALLDFILGDPGADKGGELKSKRAEKYIWHEEK